MASSLLMPNNGKRPLDALCEGETCMAPEPWAIGKPVDRDIIDALGSESFGCRLCPDAGSVLCELGHFREFKLFVCGHIVCKACWMQRWGSTGVMLNTDFIPWKDLDNLQFRPTVYRNTDMFELQMGYIKLPCCMFFHEDRKIVAFPPGQPRVPFTLNSQLLIPRIQEVVNLLSKDRRQGKRRKTEAHEPIAKRLHNALQKAITTNQQLREEVTAYENLFYRTPACAHLANQITTVQDGIRKYGQRSSQSYLMMMRTFASFEETYGRANVPDWWRAFKRVTRCSCRYGMDWVDRRESGYCKECSVIRCRSHNTDECILCDHKAAFDSPSISELYEDEVNFQAAAAQAAEVAADTSQVVEAFEFALHSPPYSPSLPASPQM
jgi:hypothetical protein